MFAEPTGHVNDDVAVASNLTRALARPDGGKEVGGGTRTRQTGIRTRMTFLGRPDVALTFA